MLDYNRLVVFAEGTTTNGEGLIPFRKGAFDIGAPVKLTCIKYKSSNVDAVMNLIDTTENVFLMMLQWWVDVEFLDVEGSFYPKKFNGWEEYAEETRKLMGKAFGMKLIRGSIQEKMQMERELCPYQYKY